MSTKQRSRGQTLAEFALVIPLFLTMLLAIFDLGRVIWATTSLASAAREGARFAIVHGGSWSDPCPVGPPSVTAKPPAAPTADCPYPAPSKQAIKDIALNAALAVGGAPNVTVCYKPNDPAATCTGDIDFPGSASPLLPRGDDGRGMIVTVVVSSQIDLITPGLLGLSSFNLSGSSSMVVNH